ncbi:MAG: TonB-dependent receptor [Desulfobacterales bacterium]|nr:TonB-dependent receptor [Desulfobacterales bacterium]
MPGGIALGSYDRVPGRCPGRRRVRPDGGLLLRQPRGQRRVPRQQRLPGRRFRRQSSLGCNGPHPAQPVGVLSRGQLRPAGRPDQVGGQCRPENRPSTRYDKGSTQDYFVKAGLDWDLRTLGQLLADLSYRDRSGDSKFPDASFPFKNDFDTETLGFTPRYVWQGNVFDRTNKLIAGVDLYHTQQDNKSYSGFFSPLPSSPTGLSDVDRDSVGAYLNNEFYVLNNLLLTLGARRRIREIRLRRQRPERLPPGPLERVQIGLRKRLPRRVDVSVRPQFVGVHPRQPELPLPPGGRAGGLRLRHRADPGEPGSQTADRDPLRARGAPLLHTEAEGATSPCSGRKSKTRSFSTARRSPTKTTPKPSTRESKREPARKC